MPPRRPHRPGLRAAAALLALSLVAACGTRLSDEEFAAEGGQQTGSQSGSDGASGGTDGTGTATDGTGSTGTDGAATDGTGSTGTDGGTGTTGGATGGTTGAAGGPNQASDVGVTATTITIGNITAENGVLGDAFAPAVRGLRAWVQAINAKGGINGRQVVLKTCDDREDRTRTLACARRLVEQDKVFALIVDQHPGDGRRSAVPERQGHPGDRHADHEQLLPLPALLGPVPAAVGYPRDGKTVGYKGKLDVPHGHLPLVQGGGGRQRRRRCSPTTSPSRSRPATASPRACALEGFETIQFTVSFAAPSFDQAVATMQSRAPTSSSTRWTTAPTASCATRWPAASSR